MKNIQFSLHIKADEAIRRLTKTGVSASENGHFGWRGVTLQINDKISEARLFYVARNVGAFASV